MSMLALMEVQRALFTKLSGDGVLMGMVSGVYDCVPQQTPVPYVIIGDGTQNVRPADGIVVSECQLELHVWTEAGGRKALLTLLNRLHALLHMGTLTLSGFQLVTLHMEQASTRIAEQGTLLEGRMTLFVALVEA
jgi:hypothetical protein